MQKIPVCYKPPAYGIYRSRSSYDRDSREVLWWAMRVKGVPEKYLRLIRVISDPMPKSLCCVQFVFVTVLVVYKHTVTENVQLLLIYLIQSRLTTEQVLQTKGLSFTV